MAGRGRCLVLFLSVAGFIASTFAVHAPKFKLDDGHEIPALALGTWLGSSVVPVAGEVEKAVEFAIDAGYRHIDTAWKYQIEDQVGRGIAKKIAEGVVKREDIFVTTKLWNEFHARDAVVPALRQSLKDLQLDYVDLYLIHWPVAQFENKSFSDIDYLSAWQGMVEARDLGLARSIGVSNFNQQQIDRILANSTEKPQVLQVELNLNLQQPSLRAYCKTNSILLMAYTPFGSLFHHKAKADSPPPRVDTPELKKLADKYNKSVTQVTLRYLYELGVIPIPKSVTKARIEANIDIFDFQLSEEDKLLLKSYDKNYRTLPQAKWSDSPYYPFEKN